MVSLLCCRIQGSVSATGRSPQGVPWISCRPMSSALAGAKAAAVIGSLTQPVGVCRSRWLPLRVATVQPRVLAATIVSLALSATVILVGLAGAYLFVVYIQNVSPGAFAAGLTLIIGATDVVIALIKAALFGLSAGLIACYKGISVRGGPAGVGNAVNETAVFTFMALFAINIVATAVAIKITI